MYRRTFLAGLAAFSTTRQKQFNLTSEGLPALSRVPYVQNVTSDQATILWATDDPDNGSVEYSSNGVDFTAVWASAKTFPSFETTPLRPFTQYEARLAGLLPNTLYVYRVSVGGAELAQGSFRTAGPGPFRFVVIGDSGQGRSPQFQIGQRLPLENPAFLIHAGDIAYMRGSYNDFQLNHFDVYNTILSSLPYFPVPGNHEYDDGRRPTPAPFVALHSVPTGKVPAADRGLYYSFDWGNAHFICLDSNKPLEQAITSNGEMLRWLERDLRATRQFWRIAVVHHPPYAGGPNQFEISSALVRTRIVPILEKYGVQLMLSGHEHSYQRSHSLRNGSIVAVNTGTVYMTSGGGGASLYNVTSIPQIALSRSEHHYLTVDVDGSSMLLTATTQTGAVIDRVTLSPLPALIDDGRAPVSITAAANGSLLRIRGRSLAIEERFVGVGAAQLAQTSVAVDGVPLSLIYVSGTLIWARSSAAVQAPFVLKITNPNGSTETTIRQA